MPLTFPAGVGSKAARIDDEAGADVSGVAIGEAVFSYGQNTVAEQAVLRSWVLSRRPMYQCLSQKFENWRRGA